MTPQLPLFSHPEITHTLVSLKVLNVRSDIQKDTQVLNPACTFLALSYYSLPGPPPPPVCVSKHPRLSPSVHIPTTTSAQGFHPQYIMLFGGNGVFPVSPCALNPAGPDRPLLPGSRSRPIIQGRGLVLPCPARALAPLCRQAGRQAARLRRRPGDDECGLEPLRGRSGPGCRS